MRKSVPLLLSALLIGCASPYQRSDEVFLRKGAGDLLHPWKSLDEASTLHWPYAWASVAAYEDHQDPEHRTPHVPTAECPDPDVLLSTHGWIRWQEIPRLDEGGPGTLGADMREVHLRAEVWSSEERHQVIVAFGGTAGWVDTKANARWFVSWFGETHDQYSVVSRGFKDAFLEAYRARALQPGGKWLQTAELVSTGHSLGAGLAQRFAYSLPPEAGRKVSTVFAFDTSPVSGKRSSPYWEQDRIGLSVFRIYNRDETLAFIRSLETWWEQPPTENPAFVDVRYEVDWDVSRLLPVGSVKSHGLLKLACVMKQHAGL